MRVYESITELVGNTPLLHLKKIEEKEELVAKLYGKLEFYNPGGSVKDRIALNMIESAEKDGRLKPGGTVIEGTSGNTGIGIAAVCAAKGYKAVICMPENMSKERISILKAYGAEVHLTPAEKSMGGSGEKAKEKPGQREHELHRSRLAARLARIERKTRDRLFAPGAEKRPVKSGKRNQGAKKKQKRICEAHRVESVIVPAFAVPGNKIGNLVDPGGNALTNGLINEDRGGGADIQGIGKTEHRDPDAQIGTVHPLGGKTVLLGAKRDGDIAGQIHLEMEFFGVGSCGKNRETARLEKLQRLFARRFDNRHREHRAGGGADDIGVVDIGSAVADDHRRHLGGIGRAENRAEIAGLFDRLGDNHQRIGRQIEIGEFPAHMRPDHQQPVRTLFVGDFLEADFRACIDFRTGDGAFADDFRLVLVLEVEIRTMEERMRPVAVVERTAALAVALDNHFARLLARSAAAELHDMLELGIGRRCDFDIHC